MSARVSEAVLNLTTGGTLVREFEQIKAGARGADTEFEKLRRRVQDVGGELRKTVERFSGRALVEEAQRVAQAVTQIGGASKLTKAELRDVAATVDAATQKLQRMGEDVPPSIRKLNAEIKALDDGGKKASSGGVSSLLGGLGGLRSLLPALTLAGAVGGIGMLARQALATASEIGTLSDRLGVSTTTVQQWQYVAGQAGTTAEAFGSTAFRLGVAVAEGSKKTQSAVGDLGLSFRDLQKLKPEDQFHRVIAALEGVESVTERNRIGQALFGRQFSEIAESVAKGYTRMRGEAALAGEAQIRAAGAAGDAWARFRDRFDKATVNLLGRFVQEVTDKPIDMDLLNEEQMQQYTVLLRAGGDAYGYLLQLERERTQGMRDVNLATEAGTATQRNYIQELAALKARLAELTPEQRKQLDAALELDGASEELAAAFGLTEQALRLYTSAQKDGKKATSEHAKEVERLQRLAAGVRLGEHLKNLGGEGIRAQIAATNQEIALQIDWLGAERQAIDGVVPAVASWQAALVPLKGAVTEVNGELVQQQQDINALAIKWRDFGRSISQILAQAFTGGGGLDGAFKALGALGGQKLGEHLGKSLATAVGGKFGAMLGGMAGPLGAALGSLGGSLIGKLFGGNAEHRRVNDMRDAFTKTAGGIHALNVKAQAAGLTLERFLRAKTVAEYEAAVAELEQAFADLEEQTRQNQEAANTLFDDIMAAGAEGVPAAMRETIERFIELGLLTDDQIAKLRGLGDAGVVNIQKMDDALALFNGRVEALGPAYAQAKIDETSAKYINAIDYATKHGASLDQMLHDAKEELSSLVQESLKSGTSLPANMKPWIESLAAQGKLVDEQGNKITDLSKINWGPEMKTEAQIAEEGWDKILAAIERLVEHIAGPLEDALDDVTRDRTINLVPKVGDVDIDDYRDGQRTQPEPFKEGIFRGRFASTGTPALLHGIESVVPRRDELAFARRVLSERGGGPTSTTTNQAAILGIIMGEGRSRDEIGREAARFLADKGLAHNVDGVATAFHQFLDTYVLSRRYGTR